MAHDHQYGSLPTILAVIVVAIGHTTALAERPLVGAIRWDAWQEDGKVRAAVEKSLGPAHWHHRLP